jgi:hypothetical protein
MLPRSAGRLALFTTVLMGLLTGCSGNQSSEVTGTVLVDGQPPDEGSISFVPEDGKSQTFGDKIVNGKYTANGGFGTMKVDIRVSEVVGKKEIYPGKFAPTYREMLPAKYNTKTELRFDVKPGRNEKNWELTTK